MLGLSLALHGTMSWDAFCCHGPTEMAWGQGSSGLGGGLVKQDWLLL